MRLLDLESQGDPESGKGAESGRGDRRERKAGAPPERRNEAAHEASHTDADSEERAHHMRIGAAEERLERTVTRA